MVVSCPSSTLNPDSIVALATPWMASGVAVLRLSGPLVRTVLQDWLGSPKAKARYLYKGVFRASGRILDEGLWVFFPGPRSYTGEDVLELYPHGSLVVVQALIDELKRFGFRSAREGEFTERAFLNGKIDLSQAEAVKALIDSVSLEGAVAASASLRGYVRRSCDELEQSLFDLRVRAESWLDFSDEDIDPADHASIRRALTAWLTQAEAFLSQSRASSLSFASLSLMILGEPNVGKSSLMNRLSSTEASIVSPIAGTTRDIVRQETLFASHRVALMDTAGIRETHCAIEREGIRRIHSRLADVHCILWVLDASRGDLEEQARSACAWLSSLEQLIPMIFIMNKIDAQASSASLPARLEGHPAVAVSCHQGLGIDSVVSTVLSALSSDATGVRFFASMRQVEALTQSVVYVKEALMRPSLDECFADDLSMAHRALMTVLGYVGAEDVLGGIFSTFCIGK